MLGNGFDISYGLENAYNDFARWILNSNGDLYYKIS
ncbi:hypothetical protein [Enterococcus faecium]|nr:hypothetical protein [Enterococcus faecium]